MIVQIQAYQGARLADFQNLQTQLHGISQWLIQHPHYNDDHHRVEITIDPANPLLRYLLDGQPTKMTILEYKAVLLRVLNCIRKGHAWWEEKKMEVQQRVSIIEFAESSSNWPS